MAIRRGHVYQFQELPKSVSTSRMSYNPVRSYVFVKSVSPQGIARCKVVLVLEQPKHQRFTQNSWIYVPEHFLRAPDIYPKYAGQPDRWIKYAKQPVVESALEILQEKFPNTFEVVTAALIQKRELKVGQKWASQSMTLTIEKMWDKYFIVKDKFGDRMRYTAEELTEKLTSGNFKLLKSFDKQALLKAVGALLAPFMGFFLVGILLKTIEKFLKE